MTLEALIAEISRQANLPLEEACSLPPEAYVSEELFELEKQAIFNKEWLCAGRSEELQKAGDYLTHQIGEQSVIVMKQKDGSLKAFANVCRHRMMTLLEGEGRCPTIVCPYHAWSYGIDGKLKKAPHMERTVVFDPKSVRLAELPLEVWQGWIYVSLNPDARPVAELLQNLEPLTGAYGVSDYVQVIKQDHVWHSNWKVLTENFMEGMHLPFVHRKSVGAWFPAEETAFGEGREPAFTYQTFLKTEEAMYGTAHPANDRLEGIARRTSIMPTVFPTHMYVLAPDHCWYLSLSPLSVDKIKVRFGVALAPEVLDGFENPEMEIAQIESFFDQVNDEDRGIIEGVYKGASSHFATQGRLSWLEKELHDFQAYLAGRLGPAMGQHLKEVGT